MKHQLMHPAYPDIVREWALTDACERRGCRANDNCDDDYAGELSDPLIGIIARLEIERTRLW